MSVEEKSIIERTMEYIKDSRTEGFDDDYYPFRKSVDDCNQIHVHQWRYCSYFIYFI